MGFSSCEVIVARMHEAMSFLLIKSPSLLMDETLAELDEDRRTCLLDYLHIVEQALLTTTDLNLFPAEFSANCERWMVNQGNISKQ